MESKFYITLQLGDWSHDGHNVTEVYSIESNLSPEDLQKAYRRGVARIGIDIEDLCDTYQEGFIEEDDYRTLRANGLKDSDLVVPEEDYNNTSAPISLSVVDGCLAMDTKMFARLYLWCCRLGDEGFQWTFTEEPIFRIGGYGLFDL